jgi:lipopolysaccharide/colanic/teichoic acid biosynthesis glycosyltransferase
MAVVDQVVGEAAIRPARHPAVPAYFRWKGWIDRALAALLLFPALPVIGCLVLLVRLTSRGPGVFAQVRVGLNGRKFTMYKLRTMRVDAEARTGAVWCMTNDPRITRLGSLLRRLHLDELPQLFNVLKGEMSLVGPRPERPEFVEVLSDAIPGYLRRLDVPPGVTGLAQVNLPPDTDLDSVRRKLVLDIEYARTGSAQLDLRLILCTALRVLGLRYGRSVRLLGLQRSVVLEDEPEGDEAIETETACRESAARKKTGIDAGSHRDTVVMTDTVEMDRFVDTLIEEEGSDDECEGGTPDAIARVVARHPR